MKRSRRNVRGPNQDLVEAVLKAAEQVGSDGKGRDGLQGYMIFLAKEYLPQYLALLAKVMELEPAQEPPEKVFRTRAEIEAEMKARGLPIPTGMFS
jgi:hypothetical protein